jgi:hypothetical protein
MIASGGRRTGTELQDPDNQEDDRQDDENDQQDVEQISGHVFLQLSSALGPLHQVGRGG